jgi:Uma2 family endonuclease
MTAPATSSRPFKPGTLGWTASDLDDPAIEREWFKGNYEIVEGVLTTMPPAYFAGGNAVANLIFVLKSYAKAHKLRWRFAAEADIVVDELRVPRADAAMLTDDDFGKQQEAAKSSGKENLNRVRILVPPTLIIESLSPGHESHDRRTKKMWYAEFGVDHYWIVDAYAKTMECFRRAGRGYVLDIKGKGSQIIRPPAFSELSIPLREIWDD